jgi:predicted ArsR family transcriptional regulator
MPVIDLRDPETRAGIGLITETVSVPCQPRRASPSARSRGETMDLIIHALSNHGPMTRLEIAHHLGRGKSPWLIAICEDLVSVGLIRRGYTTAANGRTAILYGVEL